MHFKIFLQEKNAIIAFAMLASYPPAPIYIGTSRPENCTYLNRANRTSRPEILRDVRGILVFKTQETLKVT